LAELKQLMQFFQVIRLLTSPAVHMREVEKLKIVNEKKSIQKNNTNMCQTMTGLSLLSEWLLSLNTN